MAEQLYKFTAHFGGQAFDFQLARHPSEGDEYFVTRVLAYILHYQEGISAYGQVCQGGERPALAVFAPDQSMREWLEIGVPATGKLKEALRRSEKVFVYLYKQQHAPWQKILAGLTQRERVTCYRLPSEGLKTLLSQVETQKRNRWHVAQEGLSLCVNQGHFVLEAL